MSTRARLDKLEAEAGDFYSTLTLPDGTTVRYTTDEALEAVGAAIHRTESPMLARFVEANTAEGLPGLCRSLVGSWARG